MLSDKNSNKDVLEFIANDVMPVMDELFPKNEAGFHTYIYESSYDDLEDFPDIAKSNNPYKDLLDYYNDLEADEPKASDLVFKKMLGDKRDFFYDHVNEVSKFIDNMVIAKYDIKAILNTHVNIMLVLNTGDKHEGYKENIIRDKHIIGENSSLLWLIRKLGLEREFRLAGRARLNEFSYPFKPKEKNDFVYSCVDEALNQQKYDYVKSFMLCIPLSVSVNELIDLINAKNYQKVAEYDRIPKLGIENGGSVLIEKGSRIGLYDDNTGEHGGFNIRLLDEIRIPLANLDIKCNEKFWHGIEEPIVDIFQENLKDVMQAEHMPKYILDYDSERDFDGRRIYRIKACRDIGEIKKGEIGGWVEGYSALAPYGKSWIDKNSIVLGNAAIINDAQITGGSYINADNKTGSKIIIRDNAKVHDAFIGNCTETFYAPTCDIHITNYAQVTSCVIGGKTVIKDNAVVCGLCVDDNEKVYNTKIMDSILSDDVCISNNTIPENPDYPEFRDINKCNLRGKSNLCRTDVSDSDLKNVSSVDSLIEESNILNSKISESNLRCVTAKGMEHNPLEFTNLDLFESKKKVVTNQNHVDKLCIKTKKKAYSR